MTAPPIIFDRTALHRRKARAARRRAPAWTALRDHLAEELLDRVEATTRDYASTLVVGAGEAVERALRGRPQLAQRLGRRFHMETAPDAGAARGCGVVGDLEHSPLGEARLDLVLSAFDLHSINDLPGALIQLRHALRPDGLLVAAMAGGQTLSELRAALLQAETETTGGAGARVAPFADAFDVAGLLQRTGYALPVADRDVLRLRYGDLFALLAEVRAAGQTFAAHDRAPPLKRATLLRAAEIYQERFADADGRVRATLEILYATGWAPAATQPKPLRPGSATTRLADALGVTERSAGERAGDAAPKAWPPG